MVQRLLRVGKPGRHHGERIREGDAARSVARVDALVVTGAARDLHDEPGPFESGSAFDDDDIGRVERDLAKSLDQAALLEERRISAQALSVRRLVS